jgi:hypothetical protein
MTAISTQRMTGLQLPMRTLKAEVAANQVIRKGALCGFLGGYLYVWDAIEGLAHPCIAILTTLQTEVDNTGGADGDETADVDFLVEKMLYPFANDDGAPLTQAHIGGTAYGLDNQTVTADGAGGSAVGTPWIISTGGGTSLRAGVYIELAPGSLAALAAEAYAFAAAAPSMQTASATLVAGTATINTNVIITAESRVIANPTGVLTGTTNYAQCRELTASRVEGIAGVGSIVVEALTNTGVLDSDAAGAIHVIILTPQV